MAAFASKDFNASRYQAYRPSYPEALYDAVYEYHSQSGASWNVCVDLGCGTGQSTRKLAERFNHVFGVDPSAAMIETAKTIPQVTAGGSQVEYIVGSAEVLPFLRDGSVDMVTAATAAQYFDFEKLWPELARVLKPSGIVAFWSYTIMRLGDHLHLNEVLKSYAYDITLPPTESVARYHTQPGFSIVESALDDIADPGPPFTAIQRVKYTGPHRPEFKDPKEVILKVQLSWDQFEGWLRTWSAFHKHQADFPDDKQNPEGDVAARFVKKLKDAVVNDGGDPETVNIDQPMALLLMKKAA